MDYVTAGNLFWIGLILSSLFDLILGIIILTTKNLTENKKKVFGILLLIITSFYFLCMIPRFYGYQSNDIISSSHSIWILLCLLINLVGGLIFLISKTIKDSIRRLFGIVPIILPFISALMTLLLIASGY